MINLHLQELTPTIFKLLLAFDVRTKILPILVISILQYNVSERKSLKPQKENQSPHVNVKMWVVTQSLYWNGNYKGTYLSLIHI